MMPGLIENDLLVANQRATDGSSKSPIDWGVLMVSPHATGWLADFAKDETRESAKH
jgi:hypothetical protein